MEPSANVWQHLGEEHDRAARPDQPLKQAAREVPPTEFGNPVGPDSLAIEGPPPRHWSRAGGVTHEMQEPATKKRQTEGDLEGAELGS